MLETLYYIVIYPIQLIIEILFNTVYYWQVGIGLTIFIVSLFVNLGSLPMFLSAYKLQKEERDIQEKMASKVKSIKENFKGAEKFMILSTYYRQNNYHPIMSLRISLSLLLEIPFFTAAYLFFSHLDMLNGMSWWIIKDLSLPDGLLKINNLSINILPILMTIFNIISCEIYMKGSNFKEKSQIYGLAFVFLIILYNSPSGLVLYWTFNNLISLIRSLIIRLKRRRLMINITLILLFSIIFIKIPTYLSFSILLNIWMLFLLLFIPIIFWIQDIKNNKNNVVNSQEKLMFVLSLLVICFFLGFIVPTNLVCSDLESFYTSNNSFFKLLSYPFSQSCGFLFFWPLCFYFFISNRYKKFLLYLSVYISFLLLLSLVSYKNIGHISNEFKLNNALSFSDYYSNFDNIKNLLYCLFISIVTSFLIYKRYFKIVLNIIYVLLISMILLFCINCIKINKYYVYLNSSYISEDNLKKEIHLSKKDKNIVIFMVDRAISSFLPIVFNDKEELKNIYTGFVYYPNCVSYYTSTILGLPPILGGYEYTPKNIDKNSKTIQDSIIEACFVLPGILKNNNWDVSLFDLPITFFNRNIYEKNILEKYGYKNNKILRKYSDLYGKKYIKNYYKLLENQKNIQIKDFLLYSFTITAPHIFKDFLYEQYKKSESALKVEQLDSYASLFFLPKITDFNSTKNNFIFITNLLTHEGQILDYPDYKLNGNFVMANNIFDMNEKSYSFYCVNTAMLLLIGDFIKYLKENDVYDNTRIIIVSDHGSDHSSPTFSSFFNEHLIQVNPLLFVKDFNAKGEYKTDYSFMTNADVPFIATNNIIDNPINPFTNNLLDNTDKNDGVLLTYGNSLWNASNFTKTKIFDRKFKLNFVKDNVFDEKNWILDYKYEDE